MRNRGAFITVAEERKNDPISTKSRICNLRKNILPPILNLNLLKVIKINSNIFTHAAYQIKRSELEITHGRNLCQAEILLHATAASNIASILKNNLDWRRVRRSKYGIGVSFSHDGHYANKYCNNRNGSERAFLVCEVLIGKVNRVRDNKDTYPENTAHTYKSSSRMVVVKFDDFTFYPIFVIYYSTQPSSLRNSLSMPVITEEATSTQAFSAPRLQLKPTPTVSKELRPQRIPALVHKPQTAQTTYGTGSYSQLHSNFSTVYRPVQPIPSPRVVISTTPTRPRWKSNLLLKIGIALVFCCAIVVIYYFIIRRR